MAVFQFLRRVLTSKTVQIWFPINDGPLIQDAKAKGIDGMILAEVQLENLSNVYAPVHPSHRPAGVMLVDLAVLPEHVSTIRSVYGPVTFTPFSDDDPLVFSQPGNDGNLKRAVACRKILRGYHTAQIRQPQRQDWGPEEQELISNWFENRIGALKKHIKSIHGYVVRLS